MSKDGKYFKCAKTPNGEAQTDEEKKELLEFGHKVQPMRNGVCDCAAAGDSVAASNVAEVFQQLGDAAVKQPLLADMSHPQWDTVPACKMHTNQPSPEHADTASTPNIPDAAQSPQQPPQMTANRQNSNSSSNDANTNINNTTESPAATINSNNTNGPPLPSLRPTQPPHQPPRKGSAASNAAAAHPPVQTTRSTGSNGEDETDVIGDLVGHFGKWQCLMTMLLSLFQVPNTFHISSSVYQAANKNFWCMRPPHLQHLPVDVWRNLSDSNDNCFQAHADWSQVPNDTVKLQQHQHQQQQQQLYQQHQQLQEHQLQQHQPQSLLSGPFAAASNASRVSCAAWEYDSDDNLGNTWTSEWDLVCDKEYLKNVAEMFFLLGVATGGLLSGYLSDKFGRKKMLFISAVLQTIFGLALYFANSFEMYLTLRALLGLMSVSVTYAGLILAIEYVDGKWRTIAGMYNLFPLPISYMLISGIAYLTQDYQRLQLCIGIPGFFLCFLWFVVPESPRWLLVKGRIAEVKIIVQAAADFNGRQLPPNFESMLQPPPQEENSQDCMRLFRSSYLRRISICFLCIWFTMNLVYYGLILNMSSFGGNVYLNSALAGLVEIPAIAIAMYIITKVGKKWLFSATLICTAIACCCAAITEGQDDLLWLKITFLMIGKFTISAGNTIMPVYTAELYPTAIRNVGVGACNVAAGLALILTPYLSLLTKIESHLLMSLLTAWTLFGGFVVLFLPESTKAKTKIDPPEEKC